MTTKLTIKKSVFCHRNLTSLLILSPLKHRQKTVKKPSKRKKHNIPKKMSKHVKPASSLILLNIFVSVSDCLKKVIIRRYSNLSSSINPLSLSFSVVFFYTQFLHFLLISYWPCSISPFYALNVIFFLKKSWK